MHFSIFLCLIGFLFVQASPVDNERDYYTELLVNNANEFFDGIIKAIKEKFGPKLEPLHLPDKELKFDKKIGPIDIKGDVKLHDGLLTGLSTLHRVGDAQIANDEKGNIKAAFKVELNNMKFHYNADLEFIHIKKKVLLEGGDLLADVRAVVVIDSNTGKPELKEFEVTELKGLVIRIHGLGPLDPLVDLIAKAAIELFNPQIRHLIDTQGKKLVEDAIKDFKIGGGLPHWLEGSSDYSLSNVGSERISLRPTLGTWIGINPYQVSTSQRP